MNVPARVCILLVDDHAMVRQGLRAFLAVHPDLEVVGEAATVAEARAQIDLLAPDVVLLDLQLPDGDALDVLSALRPGEPPRVLVVTSFPDDPRAVPVVRAGAAGYVHKDIAPDALAAALRSVHGGQLLFAPEVAAALLRASGEPVRRAAALTEREREVLREIAAGRSNREIARRLGVTEKTVKSHVSNLLGKLGLADRTQAAVYAVRHGVAGGAPR